MKLYHNAKFHTMDDNQPQASAVLVDDHNRIIALDPQEIPQEIERVDLNSVTVLPGFYDSHCHLWKWGLRLTAQVDADELPVHVAKRPAGKWIIARGTHPLTRAELDAISADHPILLSTKNRKVANTPALKAAKLDCPNGILSEADEKQIRAVMPPLTDEDYAEAILTACHTLLSMGVVAAADPLLTPRLTRIYKQIEADLPIRVVGYPIRRAEGAAQNDPMPEYYSGSKLKIDGVKFFADGGATSMTAGVSQPYINGKKGTLYYHQAEMLEEMQAVDALGLRIVTHAIGDEAIEMLLNVYEHLSVPCRIEHLGLATPQQLTRCRDLGVMVSTQPAFLPAFGVRMREVLHPSYLDRCYPFREMIDIGIMTAFSSDMPFVKTPDPLPAIQAAQDRLCEDGLPLAPHQAVTWEEAIRAYTLHGAIACGDAADYGSITPGKLFLVTHHHALDAG